MSGLIWLASFPKSGSTWLRMLLENLRADTEHPVDINRDFERQLGPSRRWMDALAGIDTSELTLDEVSCLRPKLYRYAAAESIEPRLVKVHDAYSTTADGTPLFPPEASHACVYLVRNPLDVCVSWAHHFRVDLERAAEQICDDELSICTESDRFVSQVGQQISSWSRHVSSWVDSGPGVHVVRYEDLKRRPHETFSRVAQVLGIPHGDDGIARAVRFSDFGELRAQERRNGFRERPPGVTAFFRQGEIGAWREAMSRDLARRIIERHAEVMRRFGYLAASGEVLDGWESRVDSSM